MGNQKNASGEIIHFVLQTNAAMLLSIPTWLIHLSSMIEWGMAALLLYRYGASLGREDIKTFARLMLPHWAGGWCVIAFHFTGDAVSFWLDASKVVNFVGSVCLLYASADVIIGARPRREAMSGSLFLAALLIQSVQTFPELYWRAKLIDAVFQLSSAIYFFFLLSLLLLYRRDKSVFSPVSIVGFWFLLVFVAVSVVCIYFSKQRGYPTLTHDDLLHGFAESFLTISNLLIVIGIRQKQRALTATNSEYHNKKTLDLMI
jgi:hypothetical protein